MPSGGKIYNHARTQPVREIIQKPKTTGTALWLVILTSNLTSKEILLVGLMYREMKHQVFFYQEAAFISAGTGSGD